VNAKRWIGSETMVTKFFFGNGEHAFAGRDLFILCRRAGMCLLVHIRYLQGFSCRQRVLEGAARPRYPVLVTTFTPLLMKWQRIIVRALGGRGQGQ
jgi:hypothetical protein